MSNQINSICKRILKVSDEDVEELLTVAKEQAEYNHPLKNGTAIRLHKLAKHNFNVLEKFKALRDAIKSGAGL